MSVSQLFKGKQDYTPGENLNPAEQAKREWDHREGRVVNEKKNQTRYIQGLIVVVIIMAIGLVVQSLKATVIPVFIEVDHLTGEIRNMGKVQEQQTRAPRDVEIISSLRKFIVNTREMTIDPYVYKGRWNDAYAYLTKNAADKMTAKIQAENPSQYFGKRTIQVNIISILPIEGGSSYQARWTEEEFEIGSGQKRITPMSGVFTITIIPSKDEQTIAVNPFGVYLSDFNWTQDASSVKK
ncbi:type IV secretion system protein [Anaerospora hongkongensis]|uniref:type IV secretion system protein n=1 Tax=Anaerospora hongkongensis TaxID=244830 RepID=UPI002FDADB69